MTRLKVITALNRGLNIGKLIDILRAGYVQELIRHRQ